MTNEQKIQALWECIQRDGDETAAEAFGALRQRAEQAERERDAAREGMSGQQRLYAEVEEKLERAEADNAALVVVLRGVEHVESRNPSEGMRYCPQCGECEAGHTEECVLGNALHGAFHTGAALLERMRVLEDALRDAVEWMRRDGGAKERGETCRHAGSCKWQRAETVLLRAANAMQEKP